jgi:Kef-type K+ transport system membrane component KefB/nucleotide-binding universal stress UspA family protein
MEQTLVPLSGHAILLLFVQLAVLLVVARLGSELVRRLGLPTVVGELAAGIVIGPSCFGHFFPRIFLAVFPHVSAQFHLLEMVSWLGMVLLLLITGIETDLRLLKHLGRAALAASVFGMIVPFAFGLGLGWWMPERFVAAPDHRVLFSLFIATALSISAMPVIAKILIDLDLTRRNIGVVILSAGVVDDTTGWIILSLIAGAATTGNPNLRNVAISVGGTVLFVAFVALVLFPLLKAAFRVANDRFQSKDTDLVLMIVVTLLCAAATDALGVHAIFGAFVAGCAIRQVPRLREETLHKLESFTFSIFAPIFFGMVGLKVDLWQLSSWNMLLLVLGVATAGKLVGCTAGSLLGGLRFGESISIAVAMNARGAMELVVATIGLSLGILNQEMFSIIVMVAVVTSFMAPLLLRLTMRMVRITEDEAERLAADAAKGLFDPEKIRILVPTAGGPNALIAAQMAMRVARRSAHPIAMLYVERKTGLMDRLTRLFGTSLEGKNLASHMEELKRAAADCQVSGPSVRTITNRDIAVAIAAEAEKGYDLILVGASDSKSGVRGEKLERLVSTARCHIAIVKSVAPVKTPFRNLLVPVDGTFHSRIALELAIRYAEGEGGDAEVTIAVMTEDDREGASVPPAAGIVARHVGRTPPSTGAGRDRSVMLMVDSLSKEGGLEKLSPVFRATKARTRMILRKAAANGSHPLLREACSGRYDLVVLGAEHRAIHYRLFFGYETERLLEESPVTTALVIPRVGS